MIEVLKIYLMGFLGGFLISLFIRGDLGLTMGGVVMCLTVLVGILSYVLRNKLVH